MLKSEQNLKQIIWDFTVEVCRDMNIPFRGDVMKRLQDELTNLPEWKLEYWAIQFAEKVYTYSLEKRKKELENIAAFLKVRL